MTFLRRESGLVAPVASYARRRSFRRQELEVQFYDYKIDIYGFSQKLDLTIAIELKIDKWQRAFQQAFLYRLCSDLVFIAVPVDISNRVDLPLLDAHGIGLIGVDQNGRCRQVLSAARSDFVRPHYRNFYINFLLGE